MPPFVADKIAEAAAGFGRYPPICGTLELRNAIADWIGRRYGALVAVDPAREVLPLNGSREGLFYAALPLVASKSKGSRRS
jgi:aspartate/methionine/tyrosine aminotransferase